MKTEFKPLNKDELGLLIALAGLLFGGWTRIYTVVSAQFPINDGGMFYKMTQVIIQNGFKIPASFEYNGFNIAYAYPPLAFYLAAGINQALQIPLLEIFRFGPAIILILTIPVFYLLAISILGDKLQAGIATLFFSLMPRSITWFIMGGGITRSLGLLFLILVVRYLYITYTQPGWRYSYLSIVFCALVVLSHPEAALHTIAIAILIWLYYGRTRDGFLKTTSIGIGTILLTSIWWLPLLAKVGLEPVLAAGRTGLNSSLGILYPFVHFNLEPYITFVMVFGFLGMIAEIAARRYFLTFFYFLPFVVELRSSANVAIVPLAMLSSIALCNLILPGLRNISRSTNSFSNLPSSQMRVVIGGFTFLSIYLVASMHYHATQLAIQHVSLGNRAAMRWLNTHTPEDSKFLVITGNNDPLRDWTSEWFPALTDRSSVTTVQGREWIREENFVDVIKNYQGVQGCLYSTNPLMCILDESTRQGLTFDYVYVGKILTDNTNQTTPRTEYLIFQLEQSENYRIVYNDDMVIIFVLTVPVQ